MKTASTTIQQSHAVAIFQYLPFGVKSIHTTEQTGIPGGDRCEFGPRLDNGVCRYMQVSMFLCVGSDFFPPPVVSAVFSPHEISRKGRAVGSGVVIVLGLGDSNAVTVNARSLL